MSRKSLREWAFFFTTAGALTAVICFTSDDMSVIVTGGIAWLLSAFFAGLHAATFLLKDTQQEEESDEPSER